MPNFTAVLPLLRTSHAKPKRGATSYQSGTSGLASKCRAGTNRPGATARSAIDPLKCSNRTPGLIVKRPSVQVSCA
jgi:hypothetical protein